MKRRPPVRGHIRPMAHADIPALLPIEARCFGDHWTVQSFRDELDQACSTYVVVEIDGEIVGYAGFWLILEEAHITTVAVHPDHQGQGLGEQLLVALIDAALEREARWMTLEVRVSNTGAQALYRKYGFESLGRRRGYYQNDGEDALVMWTEHMGSPEYQERLARLRARFSS
ncbi:MAG: ribosomal protein S18-alanine N-acetyltransferase [Candidatus Sericytochromatia bacterium]|nr:ribosomal protein S18-alanine N-acetyltransferase [Candidatus Sericytochromatia bacterium]